MNVREYVAKVHRCDCVVCWFKLGARTPMQEGHHVIPSDDWSMVPLCRLHHQGPTGVHGLRRRGFESFWKVNDLWLLARTAELVAKL